VSVHDGPGRAPDLTDRRTERRVLDRFAAGVRDGQGSALVVRGDPGVGKTVLLEYLAGGATSSGCRVVRATGVQSEMELAFAGLHQLCAPLLDRAGHLPEPQHEALRIAFGLAVGPPPDRFLVGLAVLGLLSEAAADRPLICVVDDQQWLDQASAQALGFAARRLAADPVGLVFAARVPGRDVAGLPELAVGGLADSDARILLDSVLTGPLDARVRDQIVADTHGNPLALLELPRGLTAAELAGGFGLSGGVPLAGQIEDSFGRQIEALPVPARRLLQLAAADPSGDTGLVWRAAGRLGIPVDAAASATEAGLAAFGVRVRFRHPLVRSAAYRSLSDSERRETHAALAEVTDPAVDPDRRAWHLAQATAGADEEVAAELERSAGRAQARGGIAAAAAFLERAALLTPDPYTGAQRALGAAQAKHLAGAQSAALALVAVAEAGPLGELQRAQADRLRAEIAYTRRSHEAPRLLLRAAERLEPLDLRLARDTYLDALWAAHIPGRLGPGALVRETAQAALRAPRPADAPAVSDLLLDGLATALAEGYPAGVPYLKQAVAEFRGQGVSRPDELRWLWAASVVTRFVWDDEAQDVLSARHVELGRRTGVLAGLPIALSARVVVHTLAGELAAADHVIEELLTLSEAMGIPMQLNGRLVVTAWRGREPEASELIEAAARELKRRGEGGALAVADYARAVLCNGLGRYTDALKAAAATDAFDVDGFTIYAQGLPELIEAAVRAGDAERAAGALARLAAMTEASGTDWGAGLHARCLALLSPDDAAEARYREAIERLTTTRVRVELGRARLLYGEWLRRQNRRLDARTQLRLAHTMLTDMGVTAFAERARRELAATGETVRKRAAETVSELTAQEAQIARLAVAGRTNAEIGAQLFISARTVEWHLSKVFTKLGIGSRRELSHALTTLEPI
jgi:DNA-binding CsgD family transcriptional regulator/tetratricopeptide (TPR) repeat protein